MLVFVTPKLDSTRPPPYSYRSRATIPSSNIDDSRVTDDITSLKPDDIAVLGKKHSKEDAEYCMSNKIKYIVDVADDKFNKFEHWYFTIPNANAVTTTCRTLSEVIQTETSKTSYVIPDPTERLRGEPKFVLKDIMNTFYYGSEANYSKLNWSEIREVLNSIRKTNIKIMTNVPERPIKISKLRKKIAGYWNLTPEKRKLVEDEYMILLDQLIEWDFDEQGKLVEESDFVMLPVVDDKHSSCKGNNRPIDALQQGRMVLTNPGIPSYEDLKDFLYIGDMSEIYQEMINQPDLVVDKITKAQEFIAQNYSPNSISKKWIEIYKTLTPSSIG